MNGYSDQTFRPDNFVTRGELAKIISIAFQVDLNLSDMEKTDYFQDVNTDHTFFQYIHALKKADIISGFSDNTYRPDQIVSRAALTKFIHNSAKLKNESLFNAKAEMEFIDLNAETPFYEYIQALYSATKEEALYEQIITLTSHKNFRPTDSATRGETAKMITNTIQYADIYSNTYYPDYSNLSSGIESDYKIADGNFRVYNYYDLNISILVTKQGFDFNYVPNNAPQIQTLAQNLGYQYIVNGSYFGGTNLDAEHAGLLNYYGIPITPIKYYDQGVPEQLTHIVRYDKTNYNVVFIDKDEYYPIESNYNLLEFQTGPLVISKNNIQSALIENSKNGMTYHQRTLMGVSDQNEKFFIVVKEEVSLSQIANILLHLSLLRNKTIDVINLDGGSSTAFYSQNYSFLNWGENKRIPVVLGFRVLR
ncbi:hypothetical protein GF362_03030 [Candidatus Dojkabacteria bacterium]|nr:hypothetical protein [Candidatus Dojkabacteria bacterium]